MMKRAVIHTGTRHSLRLTGGPRRLCKRQRPLLLIGLALGLLISPAASALITLVYPLAESALGSSFIRESVEGWTRHEGRAVLLSTLILVGAIAVTLASAAMVAYWLGLDLSFKGRRRLGDYRLLQRLDSGGVADIFLAQHARMCRPAAIKVLRSSDSRDSGGLARFEQEIRLASGLTHPNTIDILDHGRGRENTYYYAMEYLAGLNIQKLVDRFGPMPSERCVHILAQVCGSLAEAHAQSIVHRDIKPANIFLTDRGGLSDFVKVLDFGMSKKVEAEPDVALTQPGFVFGTPLYIAPESITDPENVDARADIYGLGAAAYFMLTGEPPFNSTSVIELLADHIRSAPEAPSRIAELPIDPALERIVLKCLEKSPDDRFQSIRALEGALCGLRFSRPWTGERATEWWSMHVAGDEDEAGRFSGQGGEAAGTEQPERASAERAA
ncbi:MAG: serine/threonine-protein kinase [Gemmatimonadales bacterium]